MFTITLGSGYGTILGCRDQIRVSCMQCKCSTCCTNSGPCHYLFLFRLAATPSVTAPSLVLGYSVRYHGLKTFSCLASNWSLWTYSPSSSSHCICLLSFLVCEFQTISPLATGTVPGFPYGPRMWYQHTSLCTADLHCQGSCTLPLSS